MSNFIFFWHEYEEYGYLSNWYAAPIIVDNVPYFHTEQYFMAQKALLFGDTATYNEILKESDPLVCKKLGKKVSGFDQAVYDAHCEEIMYRGNLAKFTQHLLLGELLVATGDSLLAEASPYDSNWGIGLEAQDPRALEPSKWTGKNMLGKVLMRVREGLNGTEEHTACSERH